MSNQTDDYQSVQDDFLAGKIQSLATPALLSHLNALSNQHIDNERIRHRDVIRGLTINHILLQRHMDKLDRQNQFTQRVVIWLTVVSTVAALAQVWAALR